MRVFLPALCIFLLTDVCPYGGSATANQTVAMAQTNLRPVQLDIAPLACSNVRMATAPSPVSSVTAIQTVLTARMKTLLSAVWQFYKPVNNK